MNFDKTTSRAIPSAMMKLQQPRQMEPKVEYDVAGVDARGPIKKEFVLDMKKSTGREAKRGSWQVSKGVDHFYDSAQALDRTMTRPPRPLCWSTMKGRDGSARPRQSLSPPKRPRGRSPVPSATTSLPVATKPLIDREEDTAKTFTRSRLGLSTAMSSNEMEEAMPAVLDLDDDPEIVEERGRLVAGNLSEVRKAAEDNNKHLKQLSSAVSNLNKQVQSSSDQLLGDMINCELKNLKKEAHHTREGIANLSSVVLELASAIAKQQSKLSDLGLVRAPTAQPLVEASGRDVPPILRNIDTGPKQSQSRANSSKSKKGKLALAHEDRHGVSAY